MLDNQNNFVNQFAMGSRSICLSKLIEFVVQQAYHELTILSDTLPRKSDLERKIEICNFANCNKQRFVRLLALFRWTNNANKVDRCARISSLLQRQHMFFVDTADSLARMARESLVIARLPSFSLPCAIDVLTTGSYPRLPNCIKEKILPSDSINPLEKKQTLDRLTQIIEYRIVTSELPFNMCKPIIENGKVKFIVQSEFEATLTLMSDSPTIPWRLLDIEILVEDVVVGEGRELVHPHQLHYIHQLVQAKLIDSDKPLHLLYTCLHSFCSSLQLDILNMQANMLIQQRMGNHIRIDEYIPGKQLSILYWSNKKVENKMEKNYFKMIIMMDNEKISHSLKILHEPNFTGSDCILVPKYIDSSYLSIEKLLGCIIRIRSLKKLKDLERELRLIIKNLCKLNSNTIQLSVPLLFPCLENEYLNISIDSIKGTFIVDSYFLDSTLLTEVENCLDGDHKHIIRILNTCRCVMLLERCKRTLNHACIPFQSQIKCKLNHMFIEANKFKIFIRPSMQLDYYIAVEVLENECNEGQLKFWLLNFRNEEGDDRIATLIHHHQLLPNVFCIGPSSSIFKFKDKEFIQNSRKRKFVMSAVPNKLQCFDNNDFMMKELLHLVAYIDDYLPFVQLSNLLNKNELPHTGIQLDEVEHTLSITLLRMPTSEDISKEMDEIIQYNVLSISFKYQRKNEKDFWNVQIVFHQSPITTSKFEQGQVERVHLSYEKSSFEPISKVIDSFIFDCQCLTRLYQAVLHFSELYNNNISMQRNLEVKSYTYVNLVLAYGPHKSQIANIKSAQDLKTLQLNLGISGNVSVTNYHVIVENYLNSLLNSNGSIYSLAKALISTCNVYAILNKLQTNPMPWLKLSNMGSTTSLDFTIVAQSCTHLKIIYRRIYCIDLRIIENSVALWDAHYSFVDAHNDANYFPIPGFQTFLSSYIESITDSFGISPLEYDTTASPSDAFDFFNKKKIEMTSSPSRIVSPSPSNLPLHVPSPSFVPAPSPAYMAVHISSPANNFIGQVAIDGLGSPFTNSNMITPSPRNWPSSPLIAGPSPSTKIAPSPGKINSPAVKIESGAISKAMKLPSSSQYPVILSQCTLQNICQSQPIGTALKAKESLLEQFLSCAYLKRIFLKQIHSPNEHEHFIVLGASELGTSGLKAKSSDLQIWIQPNPLQFQIKVLPVVESSNAYEQDDLLTLQKFFEIRVSCSPFKPVCLTTFLLLLKLNPRILKDFISIMRAELNADKSCRWFVQLLLTFPNGTGLEYPIGIPALSLQRKITFVLNFTKNMFFTDSYGNKQSDNTLNQGPNSFIIPLYYDSTVNLLQHIETTKVQSSQQMNSITFSIVSHLKKLQEPITQKDCLIYFCIRDLMNSLVIKTD